MNKKLLFLMPLIGAMSLAGCKSKNKEEEPTVCSHADANNDFTCDLCGATLATSSVDLDTSKVQKLFSKGEAFNATGLKVIATSEIGSKKELEFSTSTPDMSTVGDKVVTVTYGTGENDKKTYSINVSYWSEADLSILSEVTLAGYYGGLSLPFLPGHDMKVVAEIEDDELVSWKIVASNASEADLLEVYQSFLEFEKVVKIKGDDITFKSYEVAVEGAEGFHDLSKVQVLRMSASYVYQDVLNLREIPMDEYFVMGLNAKNELVIESRVINALLEDTFSTVEEICDGESGFKSSANYQEGLMEGIERYLNELAADAFVLPVAPTDADSGFFPGNLQSMYPLDESLDEYDSAWDICFTKAVAGDKTAYETALTAAGYEPVVEGDSTVYVKQSAFIGKLEILPYFDSEKNWFGFELYYTMPEKYDFVSRMHPGIVSLLETDLGVEKYDLVSTYYSSTNEEIDAWYDLTAPAAVDPVGTEGEEGYVPGKTSGEVAIGQVLSQFAGISYSVTSAAKSGQYYDGSGAVSDCWQAKVTDSANFNISVYVFEPKNGKCEVLLEINKFYEFTPKDVADIIFGEVTPTLTDGVYSATVEGTVSESSTLALAVKALAISNVDYYVFQKPSGEWYFSGLTKDGKLIYTVTVAPAEVAGEIVISLKVDTLSAKEKSIRTILNFFAHYFSDYVTGGIRHKEYAVGNDGSFSTSMYIPQSEFTGGIEEILYYISNLLPEGYALTSGESLPAVFSNGSESCTVAFSTFTYEEVDYYGISIVFADVASE